MFSSISFSRLRVSTTQMDPVVFHMRLKVGDHKIRVRFIEEIRHGELLSMRDVHGVMSRGIIHQGGRDLKNGSSHQTWRRRFDWSVKERRW